MRRGLLPKADAHGALTFFRKPAGWIPMGRPPNRLACYLTALPHGLRQGCDGIKFNSQCYTYTILNRDGASGRLPVYN